MKPPCTQCCPNRSPKCHAKCEAYLEYVKLNAVERERRYHENEIDRYIEEKFEKAVKKKARKKR